MHIEFSTDGAAFTADDGDAWPRAVEVARILRHIAGWVEMGITGGAIRDTNGNRVGTWTL